MELNTEKIVIDFRLFLLSSRLMRTMYDSSQLDVIVTDLDNDKSVIDAAESRKRQLMLLEKTISRQEEQLKALSMAIQTELQGQEADLRQSIGQLFSFHPGGGQ